MKIRMTDLDDALRVWAAAAGVDGDAYPPAMAERATRHGDCLDLAASDRRVTVSLVRAVRLAEEWPRLPWLVSARDGTDDVVGLLWRGSSSQVELTRLGSWEDTWQDWTVSVEGDVEAERAALDVLAEIADVRPYLRERMREAFDASDQETAKFKAEARLLRERVAKACELARQLVDDLRSTVDLPPRRLPLDERAAELLAVMEEMRHA